LGREKGGLEKRRPMRTFTAVVEKCPDSHLYVGYVPGFPGAHSQGASLDELNNNLKEVIEMLLDDAEPRFESEFVGTQNVVVA
jgi:predicted RNase H-like HicB family nuclease